MEIFSMNVKSFFISSLCIVFSWVHLPSSHAQDWTTWNLPEGAKARLGKGIIIEIQYSPDGSRLAVASNTGIWIYDAQTGEELDLLTGHTNRINSIAFSPDGRMLASGSSDSTIRLWDAATGEHLHTLKGHVYSVRNVAFSPDSLTITSSGDGNLHLWDVRTGEHLRTLVSFDSYEKRHLWHPRTREHLRTLIVGGDWLIGGGHPLSPDGNTLVSWKADGTLHLWDAATGEHLHTLEGLGLVSSVVFSPDGRTLAIESGDSGTTRLWNVKTGEHLHTLDTYSDGCVFSPDGNIITFGAWGTTLWDIRTGELLHTLEPKSPTSSTGRVAFSPDGKTLASRKGGSGTIGFWDVNTGKHLRTLMEHTDGVEIVLFSPDGSTLASVGDWDYVRLWDVETKSELQTLTGPRGISSVSFSPDGSTLASVGGTYDYTVRLWDMKTGTELQTLTGRPEDWLDSVAFSPDGNTIAAGSGKVIHLWDVDTGTELQTLTGRPEDRLDSVAFSPDGNTIAAGSGKVIHLWDVDTGTELQTLTGRPEDRLDSVAFSPDGNTIAAGSGKVIHLWDVDTGTELQTLTGRPEDWLDSVAFSPDGNTIASAGSWDNTIHLWDVDTGTELQTLTGHTGGVNSIAFSPDGRTLASGSWDGTVLLWDIAPPEPERLAADVNGDGVVNTHDLGTVAAAFGKTGENVADVNGDGVVNIRDLINVAAAALGQAAAPTTIHQQIPTHLTPTDVQHWLILAHQLDIKNPTTQRGILFLRHLLSVLTPEKTALFANYPNPFNPETWIPYQLAEPAEVTLTIYSAAGKVVRRLDLGHQHIGTYQSKSRAAYWDGRNTVGEPVASAVYFYTLTAGDFTATRKMLIRK